MNILRHFSWHSDLSADAPNPPAQPSDHNSLRPPGTSPRVSPNRKAPGPTRDHSYHDQWIAIQTHSVVVASLAVLRASARNKNHQPPPPASHQHRQTTTAKESTTSPRAPGQPAPTGLHYSNPVAHACGARLWRAPSQPFPARCTRPPGSAEGRWKPIRQNLPRLTESAMLCQIARDPQTDPIVTLGSSLAGLQACAIQERISGFPLKRAALRRL